MPRWTWTRKATITVSDAVNAVMRRTGATVDGSGADAARYPHDGGRHLVHQLRQHPRLPLSGIRPGSGSSTVSIPLLQKRLVVLSGHTGSEAQAALALGRQVLSEKVTERNTLRNQLGRN